MTAHTFFSILQKKIHVHVMNNHSLRLNFENKLKTENENSKVKTNGCK